MKAGKRMNLYLKQQNNKKHPEKNKTMTVQFFLKQKKAELLKLNSLWFVQVTTVPLADNYVRNE